MNKIADVFDSGSSATDGMVLNNVTASTLPEASSGSYAQEYPYGEEFAYNRSCNQVNQVFGNESLPGNFSVCNPSELVNNTDSAYNPLIALIVIPCVVILFITIFGNILVIASVCYFRALQRANNYFLVSLAVADLLVGLTAMPFKMIGEISQEWLFGSFICNFFNANDVLFTTASTLHLCCISIDRYIAIIHPFKYEAMLSTRRLILMITLTWVLSLLIAYVPIFSGLYANSEQLQFQKMHPELCLFQVTRWYAFVSSVTTFWTPLTIMLFMYLRIYREARRQENELYQTRKRFHGEGIGAALSPRPSDGTHQRPSAATNGNNGGVSPGTEEDKRLIKKAKKKSRNPSISADVRQVKKLKREHRAAKVLGFILGMFIFCFFGFFLWYTLSFGICPETCKLPSQFDWVSSALFWFGYLNSCMNPIIYSIFNKDFKKAFAKLVKKCFTKKDQINKGNYERNAALSRSDSAVNDGVPSAEENQQGLLNNAASSV